MASYKVYSHSLAEQAANLADVYSSIPAVPLAKAEIRRQARKGIRIESEGIQALTVMSLVDGYLEYFGAQTITADPRSGATRVGWWKEDSDLLKGAFRTAWARRKTRPVLSDESSRVIRGRSSTDSPLPYSFSVYQDSPGYPINGTLTVEIAYADGSSPPLWSSALTQSSFQEDEMGVSIDVANASDGTDPSSYPAATSSMEFTFTLSPTSSSVVPSDFFLDTATTPINLAFDLSLFASAKAVDEYGSPLEDVGRSISRSSQTIYVEIS